MNHEYDKIKDFKSDELKAADWIERRYEYWRTQLRHQERKLIADYVHEHDQYKEILKEYGGMKDLINDFKYPGLKDKLDQIDRLIKHEVNKLRYKKDVYITYTFKDFDIPDGLDLSDIQNPNVIDKRTADNLLNQFQYGSLSDLEIGNLTKDMGHDTLLSLRLTLPEGTHLGFFYDGSISKVIIPSNYCVKINSSKISIYKGKEMLFLKGELREREYLDKKVSKARENLVSKFSKFNKPNDFIEFEISNGLESYTINFAEKSIQSLQKNFPKSIYAECIDNHLNQIVFSDSRIDGEENIAGLYDTDTLTLYIRPKQSALLLNLSKSNDSKTVILHEAGHMADFAVIHAGEDPMFEILFNSESSKLTDIITDGNYGSLDAYEFMAEVFKCMFSPYPEQRAEIRRAAPFAVKFIEKRINDFIVP